MQMTPRSTFPLNLIHLFLLPASLTAFRKSSPGFLVTFLNLTATRKEILLVGTKSALSKTKHVSISRVSINGFYLHFEESQ